VSSAKRYNIETQLLEGYIDWCYFQWPRVSADLTPIRAKTLKIAPWVTEMPALCAMLQVTTKGKGIDIRLRQRCASQR